MAAASTLRDDGDVGPESHNISFLLTLLTMLDFSEPGSVYKDDWERGIAALHAPGLSWEVSWQMILKRFDLDSNGSIDFGEMHGLAPLDPRLASLLRVVVQTLVRLSERINGAYSGLHEAKLKMMKGTINQWRDKCTTAAFVAWRDLVRKDTQRRHAVIANLKYAPCRKCLHAMRHMIAERRASMARAMSMMRGGESRLLRWTLDAWRDAHRADQDSKRSKLMMFFIGRDEWWRQHVMETWRRFTRHERVVRRFLSRWMFQGMAKTFVAWHRHVAQSVADRNRGLAKGIAMLTGGTRLKCFVAWAAEARSQRDERDAVLRRALLRKGNLMGARVVRAWFEWYAERKAAKDRVAWRISLYGRAFRGWYQLIDDKRRHEFLQWALGPDLSIVTRRIHGATQGLRDELVGQRDELRAEIDAQASKLRHESAIERKAVREALALKPEPHEVQAIGSAISEARSELLSLHERIDAQADAQRLLSEGTELAHSHLHQQLSSLSRDVDERVTQTQRTVEARAGQEDAAMTALSEQLRSMQRSKANHEELMDLVAKLQHRPKPGVPVGVTPLLTVPYPLPPGHSISSSSSPRHRLQRAGSASASRLGATASARPLAELREVPTELPSAAAADGATGAAGAAHPYLATSEQILVRNLPADAEPPAALGATAESRSWLQGRVLVPPSSHTPSLSARGLVSNQRAAASLRPSSARPSSARSAASRAEAASSCAPISKFSQRTERLERALGVTPDDSAGEG